MRRLTSGQFNSIFLATKMTLRGFSILTGVPYNTLIGFRSGLSPGWESSNKIMEAVENCYGRKELQRMIKEVKIEEKN